MKGTTTGRRELRTLTASNHLKRHKSEWSKYDQVHRTVINCILLHFSLTLSLSLSLSLWNNPEK